MHIYFNEVQTITLHNDLHNKVGKAPDAR